MLVELSLCFENKTTRTHTSHTRNTSIVLTIPGNKVLSLCLNERGDLLVFISVGTCRQFHTLLPLMHKCSTKLCYGAMRHQDIRHLYLASVYGPGKEV